MTWTGPCGRFRGSTRIVRSCCLERVWNWRSRCRPWDDYLVPITCPTSLYFPAITPVCSILSVPGQSISRSRIRLGWCIGVPRDAGNGWTSASRDCMLLAPGIAGTGAKRIGCPPYALIDQAFAFDPAKPLVPQLGVEFEIFQAPVAGRIAASAASSGALGARRCSRRRARLCR